jgi:hypothetical protein
MKPHSLSTVKLADPRTRKEKFHALGPFARRHGNFIKGTELPETQIPACPRVRVEDLPEGFLKKRHIEALEQNQKIASCCRHPENHEVEALKSHPDEPAADIYVFHCSCGRKHRFFCVGQFDERPMWEGNENVSN